MRRLAPFVLLAVVVAGCGGGSSHTSAPDRTFVIVVDAPFSKTRPNVFRIAPTDHGVAFRLAEYMIPKGLKVALLYDDSEYGQKGATALGRAFAGNPRSVAIRETLPSGATDLAPQVLRARRSG